MTKKKITENKEPVKNGKAFVSMVSGDEITKAVVKTTRELYMEPTKDDKKN